MGIGLVQYRACIGLFNSLKCSSNSSLNCVSIVFMFMLFTNLMLCLLLTLLFVSGDIHPNPGPQNNNEPLPVRLCHINIRSLKAKFENEFLKLDVLKNEIANQFDIITISETWLSDTDNDSSLLISGFQEPFLLNRKTLGGGVACWVANHLAVKRRPDLEIVGLESLWLEIRIENKIFLLCTTYRPPYNTDVYWSDMQKSLDLCIEGDIPNIIIMGDINADFNTAQGKILSDYADRNNLSLHIKLPTRITQYSSTVLDQCLSNCPNFIKETGILPPLANNDHCTIYVNLKFCNNKPKCYSRLMWNFNNVDVVNFQETITNIDWDQFTTVDNIDEIVNSFNEIILQTAHDNIENKMVTVRPRDKPFYNGYLRRLKRSLNRLHHKAKNVNNSVTWDNYRCDRNFYFREVKRCKIEFLEHYYNNFDTNVSNPKAYFKMAKNIVPFKNAENNGIPPIHNEQGDILTSDLDKASAFNDYFSKASSLDDTNASLPNDYYNFNVNVLNSFIITEEVHDQIKMLQPDKGYGPDGISPKFIRIGGNYLIKLITNMFNKSLSLAKVPAIWKKANVIPLHKKNSRSILGNYRPVSLLSVLGKMIERIVFKHLYNHFQDNFLLSVWQSGFRPGSSTVTQLVELYHSFCNAVDNNKEIRVVFLDISKAFDKVWHKGLIFKLKHWGISGNILLWIEDYLKDRVQRVVINGQTSKWNQIKAGVPQGSVLGPLLFLVFINDITNIVKHCQIRIFADDTCLYITVDNKDLAASLINEDLDAIEKWSKTWLVDFCPNKTESMIISVKKQQTNHPRLFFCHTPIVDVKSHKHVGLWLDSNLSWKTHLADIYSKASKRINILKFFKYKLCRASLEKLFISFIRPILEYGNIVWAGGYACDLSKLDSIQNEAMRMLQIDQV